MASNRSAFKKALFIGCFKPQSVLRRREAVSLSARSRDLDTEVTKIARTCLLLLTMKKPPFAHSPLRLAESDEFRNVSFCTGQDLGSRCRG